MPQSLPGFSSFHKKLLSVIGRIKEMTIICIIKIKMQCIFFLVYDYISINCFILSLVVFFVFVVLKAGVISQARGSAYIEQNETKVMCAV